MILKKNILVVGLCWWQMANLCAQSYLSYITKQNPLRPNYSTQVLFEKIKTIQLYPKGNYLTNQCFPPVVPIGSTLMLEFDEVGTQAGFYALEIIHCNYNWLPSQYQPIEYLEGNPIIPINNFEISHSAKVPYTHFSVEIPRLKLSGNYWLRVFEEQHYQNTIFSYRFVVYENQVIIRAKVRRPLGAEPSIRMQQVDFEIDYPSFFQNPAENVKVVLRQNFRWDNAKIDLKPLFVDETAKRLNYHYFNLENAFYAGNEFRVFDTKSLIQLGTNVAKIEYDKLINRIHLYPEKPRKGRVYGTEPFTDMNGKFLIQHLESNMPTINADYTEVYFYLQENFIPLGEVHVLGGFNHFIPTTSSLMEYQPSLGLYMAKMLLKQGTYNYQFFVVNPQNQELNEEPIEGAFFQTENEYDIIVYYSQAGNRGDRVVGYQVCK